MVDGKDALSKVEQVVEKAITKTEAVATEVKQATSVVEAKIELAIEKWRDEFLRNTKFSQDTGAWNVLQGALQHLPPFIAKEL